MIPHFMKLALIEAKKAQALDEVPVGAIIIDYETKEIISSAHNLVETNKHPLYHAELLAINKAIEKLGTKYLTNCDIYVTLEPCPLCAQSISFARLRNLYFGAYDFKGGGVENGARIFNQKSCHHKPEIYGGIMEEECGILLTDFFKSKR